MALVLGEFEVLQNNSFNKGVHYGGSLLYLTTTAAAAATDRIWAHPYSREREWGWDKLKEKDNKQKGKGILSESSQTSHK